MYGKDHTKHFFGFSVSHMKTQTCRLKLFDHFIRVPKICVDMLVLHVLSMHTFYMDYKQQQPEHLDVYSSHAMCDHT